MSACVSGCTIRDQHLAGCHRSFAGLESPMLSDSDPQRIHPHTPPTSQETAMTTTTQRIDEIQARLNETLKVRPYEEQDRDEHKSQAWSDFYQHAPADLAWLLGEVERLSAERMQPEQPEPTGAEVRAAAEESTTDLGSIRDWYAGAVDEYWCDTGMLRDEAEAAFDRAIAAHDKALRRKWVQEATEDVIAHDEALDKALREQIEQQMIERAYFHIAWEKGLTIVPAGHGRAKVPPHWVEAATARLTPYLDIIRGDGSE